MGTGIAEVNVTVQSSGFGLRIYEDLRVRGRLEPAYQAYQALPKALPAP